MNWPFVVRVLMKAALLFAVINFGFVWLNPLPLLGRVSVHNTLVPGRPRLPYSDHSERAYSISLFQLDALFASHEVAAPKPADEYRVLLMGDSATWGFLLKPEDTLAARLNARRLTLPDGRVVRVYNLGYPIMSLAKDLLLLDYARRYQPDMIMWLVTLESFPYDKQLFPPLLQHNPEPMRQLITNNQLHLDPLDPAFITESVWDKTLLGQRRPLADWLRSQVYGVAWAATGIDQDYPAAYEPRQEDFEEDDSFHDLQPPHLTHDDLAFDILSAGAQMAREADVPLLIVNEPTFISAGKNSDIRYNFFYPRWAYDDYRPLLAEFAEQNALPYLDLWDIIPGSEFTNSAVHLTPAGSQMLADRVGPMILEFAKSSTNGHE
jgi:hypothetical protein